MSEGRKRTIVLDFDGLLHSYRRGWTGPVPEDDPVPGAQGFVRAVQERGYEVLVVTTRAATRAGREGTEFWLLQHGFPVLPVRSDKPPAVLYVDDRAFRFDGDFQAVLRFLDSAGGKGGDPGSWVQDKGRKEAGTVSRDELQQVVAAAARIGWEVALPAPGNPNRGGMLCGSPDFIHAVLHGHGGQFVVTGCTPPEELS